MSSCAESLSVSVDFAFDSVSHALESNDSTVRTSIGQMINRIIPRPAIDERRKDFRYPFPHLIYLTPIDMSGNPVNENTMVVVGKNVTERGIDFFHKEPIPYRRVILTIESEDGAKVSVITDLIWTRFTRQGWYDNGGRFLQVLDLNGPATKGLSDASK